MPEKQKAKQLTLPLERPPEALIGEESLEPPMELKKAKVSDKITGATIRKILDSRGNPTVEVDIIMGSYNVRAAAPSGASTGVYEVQAFPEKGVDRSIEIARTEILLNLIGNEPNYRDVDTMLHKIDGTDNFSRIGGDLAVAISLAVAKAQALRRGIPFFQFINEELRNFGFKTKMGMPYPLGNVIGGGAHAIGGTHFQEYLVISKGPSVADNAFGNVMVHKEIAKMLHDMYPGSPIGKGDEGAWIAPIKNDEDALRVVVTAAESVSKRLGFPILVGLDIAASELWSDETKRYEYKGNLRANTTDEQIDFVAKLIKKYNLAFVEDPLDQHDFEGYAKLTKRVREMGSKCIICGDDLFVTNPERLRQGIEMGAANSILIKPNQIGTLSGTLETIALAKNSGYGIVISHRSGETGDTSISHIAVGTNAELAKIGTVDARVVKINELIRIGEVMIGMPID